MFLRYRYKYSASHQHQLNKLQATPFPTLKEPRLLEQAHKLVEGQMALEDEDLLEMEEGVVVAEGRARTNA